MYQMKIQIYIRDIHSKSSQEDIDFGFEIKMVSCYIYQNNKLGCDFMPYLFERQGDPHDAYKIIAKLEYDDAVLGRKEFLSGAGLINIANFKDFEPYDKLAKSLFIHHTSGLSKKEKDEFTYAYPPRQVITWKFKDLAEFNEVVNQDK